MRRIGSTQQYADGWDRAFGKGAKTAKKGTVAKKKAAGAGGKKSAAKKSVSKKSAGKKGVRARK